MILNCAPRWDGDEAVQHSYRWNRALADEIKAEMHDLLEDDCTRENFEEHASKTSLLIFYDHGSETGLVAQGGNSYLVDSLNVSMLKGAEVYTMCCSAAKQLGKRAFRSGVEAWWGYTKPFAFMVEDEGIFCTLANLGLKLRKGGGLSWIEAVEGVKDATDEEVERIQEEGGNPWTIITLINNKNALVCWCAENPPDSDCTFRSMGIKIWGLAGHKITRLFALSSALGLIGYGIALHDFSHQVWELKGTSISLEGGYIGFLLMFLANWVAMKEYVKSLS